MFRRLAAYCIIGVFIVVILLQLNSYLSLISIPNTTLSSTIATPSIQHERYQRDYTTLVTYNTTLISGSTLLLFASWFRQYNYKKNKLLGFSLEQFIISPWQRWLRYEWRLLSSTWSLLKLIQLSCLVGLNILLLFEDSTVLNKPDQDSNVLFEDRNMYLQLLANRSAQLALTNIAMSVLLSAKLSIVQRHFFAIHQTLQWHSWFGRLAFLQVLYHATYQLQFNYDRQGGDILLTFATNVRYVTGTLMLCALTTLMLGSHPVVRLLSYRLFRWTHIASFITLICFGCLHHWAFYIFYATVLIFWVADQIDRSFETESCTVDSLPGDIVKLTCQVPYSCGSLVPGQFTFISFGSTSWLKAWFHSHPFSICRIDQQLNETEINDVADEESFIKGGNQYFTFYIKANGKDTYRLYQMGQKNREIKARISRPLGRPHITNAGSEFGDYETIVLIAEGMGITPWISVLHYIEEKQHAIKTKSVDLIWSIHNIDTFYAFEREFEEFSAKMPQELELKIYIFITGPSDPEEDYSIPTNLKFIQFTTTHRPNYEQLLFHIQQEKKDIVLGICAHEETTVKANNIGLFYSWRIKTERFEL